MARLKGKRKASSSKSSSEVNNAGETAQAEAKAPNPVAVEGMENEEDVSPVAVEGMENEEDATEVTKGEEGDLKVANDEENAVEEKVDEGNVAEEQEEENSADNNKNGENAIASTNSNENCREVTFNQENAVEEVMNGGKTAGEQEGEDKCDDNEKKQEDVDEYGGEIEERMVEQEENNQRDGMERKEIEEENKGNDVEGIEDKHDVVEQVNGEEFEKEQHVGILEENSKEQNKKSRKRNRRKKLVKRPAGKVAPQSDNKPELSGRKKIKMGENDTEQGDKIEEMDASSNGNKGKEKVAVDVQDGALTAKDVNEKEVGESSKKKIIFLNKGSRSNNVAEGTSKSDGKPATLNKKNASKRAESMGMIFMCSSKTKQDCYRYKVLGLPEGKKNVVEKIYKGMRLFLYDVDLKLLYGIYKAAARGGYNIEPQAFNSQFPAQVRYQIIEDCLPLAEEKFRKVIKDNYYTRSKFNCQLNSEQVKNLCKLFVKTGKVSRSRKLGRSPRVDTKKPDRGRRRQDEVRRPSLIDKSRQHGRRRGGNSPVAPLLRYPPLPPPTSSSSYAYERAAAREAYRLEAPRDVYRHEPAREVYRQEPARDVYRQEPARDVYRQEPAREVYRQEPAREVYRHESPREVYRLEPPVDRHESHTRSRLLDLQDAYKRDPYRERRDSFRQEKLSEHHDPYRREPLLEHRDFVRSEPVVERLDSYRSVPLIKHGESYRQERLLEHHDLYREDVRLEHRDHQLRTLEPRRQTEILNLEPRRQTEILNVEPRRQTEILNVEPRRHSGIDNRMSNRVYSTAQPPEYHRRVVDVPAQGLSVAYHPTTTGPPSEYYSLRPLYR